MREIGNRGLPQFSYFPGIVVAITLLVVGSVKLVYAWLATGAKHCVGAGRLIRRVAGCVSIAVGAYLLVGLSPSLSG